MCIRNLLPILSFKQVTCMSYVSMVNSSERYQKLLLKNCIVHFIDTYETNELLLDDVMCYPGVLLSA